MGQEGPSRKGTWARVVEAVHRRLSPGSKLAVGLSGGADSVVLAEALYRLGAKPVLLHFNHRWRGRTAEADARWVKAWGDKRKLRVVLGQARQAGRTGEGEARDVRWKFFEKAMWSGKFQHLWLAHQSDDQAETVLMQLLRGAGPEGLAGMGEFSSRGRYQVVRPLLGFSREEIRQAAKEAGLQWREDSTNEDEKSWRVRIRKKVFPFWPRCTAGMCAGLWPGPRKSYRAKGTIGGRKLEASPRSLTLEFGERNRWPGNVEPSGCG